MADSETLDCSRPSSGGTAGTTAYTPTTPGDWPAGAPADAGAALDKLAANAVAQKDPHATSTALAAGVATEIFSFSLPSNYMKAGKADFTIYGTDDTDGQAWSGRISFSSVNKGGVVTTVVDPDVETPAFADSDPVKTLAVLADATFSGGSVHVRLTVTSSLVITDLKCFHKARIFGQSTIGPA